MATFTHTGGFERAHQRIQRFAYKIEHPGDLTLRLTKLLVAFLGENAPVEEGTLKAGLVSFLLQSERHASIGDPDVLTDWRTKPPAGTIGAFVQWLRGLNQRRHEARALTARGKQEAKRARAVAYHAKRMEWQVKREKARKAQLATWKKRYTSFEKWVKKFIFQPNKLTAHEIDVAWPRFKRRLSRKRVFIPGKGRVVFSYAQMGREAHQLIKRWWHKPPKGVKWKMTPQQFDDFQDWAKYEFMSEKQRRKIAKVGGVWWSLFKNRRRAIDILHTRIKD